jgi:hypothetical protein
MLLIAIILIPYKEPLTVNVVHERKKIYVKIGKNTIHKNFL